MAKTTYEIKTADKHRKSSGRDQRGRFASGNQYAWEPGAPSPNPKGRPKSITLSEALRIKLAQTIPGQEETYAERIALILAESALNGSVRAASEIADRTEGRAKVRVDMNANISDWRELARLHGVTEEEVAAEARQLVDESTLVDSDAASHSASATTGGT
jgi:hypothetical protein